MVNFCILTIFSFMPFLIQDKTDGINEFCESLFYFFLRSYCKVGKIIQFLITHEINSLHVQANKVMYIYMIGKWWCNWKFDRRTGVDNIVWHWTTFQALQIMFVCVCDIRHWKQIQYNIPKLLPKIGGKKEITALWQRTLKKLRTLEKNFKVRKFGTKSTDFEIFFFKVR